MGVVEMRVSLERSGGFAGLSKTTTVETDNLSPSEASQLPRLLEAANFYNLPEQITASPTQPDRFQYTVTVEDEDQIHTVTVSEAALPGTLRPLIEWLKSKL